MVDLQEPSLAHRIYERLLNRYRQNEQRGRKSIFNAAFEQVITLASHVLGRWHGFSFPERKTGGWWWISRYRFESLAGWSEQESMTWCRRLVQPGMTVIDVGAHLGFYSRRLSKVVGRRGRVLAFEANPENFEVLKRNLRGYRNVEIFHNCVADRDGVFTLYVSRGHSNHSLLAGYSEPTSTVEVRGVALDSFLAARGIEQVDFIKSDTEGAEPLVIAGMAETLSRATRPNLLLEYNPAAIHCGGAKPEEFLLRVKRFGYDVRAIAPDGSLTDVPEMLERGYCNLLCQRLGGVGDH